MAALYNAMVHLVLDAYCTVTDSATGRGKAAFQKIGGVDYQPILTQVVVLK